MRTRVKQPIFLFGLQRGGTGLTKALLAAHPDVCNTRGELHQVFYGRRRGSRWQRMWRRTFYRTPVEILTRSRYLHIGTLAPRRTPNAVAKRVIDRALYGSREAGADPGGEPTANPQRLLSKGVNGTVFLTEPLMSLYPDASFVLLTRNGLAVAEGWMRRGRDVLRVAEVWTHVALEMLRLSKSFENCHLVSFEDITRTPRDTVLDLYSRLGLPMEAAEAWRAWLGVYKDEGAQVREERERRWVGLNELDRFVRPDQNERQIGRLSPDAKASFLSVAAPLMDALGYG